METIRARIASLSRNKWLEEVCRESGRTVAANVHGESFAVDERPDQDVLVKWSRRSQPAADVDSSKKSNGVSVRCLKEGKLKGVTRLRPAHVRILG